MTELAWPAVFLVSSLKNFGIDPPMGSKSEQIVDILIRKIAPLEHNITSTLIMFYLKD